MSYPFSDRGGRLRQGPRAGDRPAPGHRHRAFVWRFACVWLVSACATSAAAQTSREPAQPTETMVLTAALLAGTSDEAISGGVNNLPITGPHADADVMLTYQHRLGRATFGLSGRSVLREAQSTLTPMRQQGGFDFSYAGPRHQFQANQTVSYSPYYQFGVIDDAPPTPLTQTAQSHGDFANAGLTAVGTTTDLSWSRGFSQRTAVSALYNFRGSRFDDSELDTTIQSIGARLTRRLTRDLSLRTGYRYRFEETDSTVSPPSGIHDIDVGVDYNRAVAKRTTLSFSTGSSTTPLDDRLEFRLTGDAMFTKLIGRTWNARVGVHRSVQLLEGFIEPVLANTLTAAVGGDLQQHVAFASSASFSSGEVGLTGGTGNGTSNWRTGAGLSFRIGRRATLDAQYFLARDRYDEGVVLPPGLSNGEQQRQGVRVGFTWREPLIGN